MRVLHTADWHFGRTLEGRSRMEEQAAFVDELVDIVRREQIDLILLAGDVYDSVNPPAAAEQLFYEALSRLTDGGKRTVAVIAGNHDQPERVAASSPLAKRSGIRLVGLPSSEPLTIELASAGETAVIAALPYPSESRLRELLSEETDEGKLRSAYSERVGKLMARMAASFRPDTVNLAMSHIYVLGGAETDSERPIQVGGAYTVDPSALQVGAQYVALGHLHRPQSVHRDPLVRYSGSPLAYSFSERGQAKSVIVFDAVPGRAVTPQEIFLTCGKPVVRWEAVKGITEVYGWLDEGRDSNAWIDLEITMTELITLEQIGQLRKLHEGILHIHPIYPDTQESANDAAATREQLPVDELFRRFYVRQTGGAEPDEEMVRIFMELIAEDEEEDAEAYAAAAAEGDQGI
jgi:exonuclease SbcD